MIPWQEHLRDPRVIEYREAVAAVDGGLNAPSGSHERYRNALRAYVQAAAEYIDGAENAVFLRPFAMEALFNQGIPYGVIAVAFRASDAELARINNQPQPVPEAVDEIARLQQLPYGLYLRTPHWLGVRAAALERAGNRCALCNSDQLLQVHHRTYSRRGGERPADVIVLCDSCHGRHHDALRSAS